MPETKPLLLDTHAIIWFFEGSNELSSKSVQLINDAAHRGELLISAISLWEIAQLNSSKRVKLSMSVKDWMDRLLQSPGVNLVPITSEIACLSCDLPDFNKDPADRIIVASSLISQAKLLTRDRFMIKYSRLRTLLEPI